MELSFGLLRAPWVYPILSDRSTRLDHNPAGESTHTSRQNDQLWLSLGAADHDMPISPAVRRTSFFLAIRSLFLFSGLVANESYSILVPRSVLSLSVTRQRMPARLSDNAHLRREPSLSITISPTCDWTWLALEPDSVDIEGV